MASSVLIEALLDPACYPHAVKKVRLLETHISWVLLAGHYAYKIKKPVDLGFLDFTKPDKRRFYCFEEIRLNRRLAPQLYLDVTTIGGTPQHPVIGNTPAFEHAVRMRRFPSAKLLDRLITHNRLTPQHIDHLAATIARFHAELPPAIDSDYGTPQAIAVPARQNFQQLTSIPNSADTELLAELLIANEQEYDHCLALFEQRHRNGFIRECHGDLHLGNIVLLNDEPVVFDGIEFSPELRWIDVINDIAFLIMDLQHRGRTDLAFRFLNAYLEITGDYRGLGVLRFYLGYRATVRAKISAISASQAILGSTIDECRSYLKLAGNSLAKGRPALMITHGLPGCGKTTISQSVLEKLQAIRLRSDVERKRLFGLAAHESSGGNIYDPQATRRTYTYLLETARELLALGFPVIIDAAFLKRAERQEFKALAEEVHAPFAILSVRAEYAVLRQRIQQRQQLGNNASEAGLEVLEKLQAASEPLEADELAVTVELINNATPMDVGSDSPAWDKLNTLLK